MCDKDMNTTQPNSSLFDMSPGMSLAGVTCGIIVIILGLFGNVLIILAVLLSKPLYKISNVFVVSLAVCDLFQSLLLKPLYVHTYLTGQWVFGREVCLFVLYASNLAILESILHITAIAFHRYIIMVHPLKASRMTSPRALLIMLLIIYVLPFCLIVLPSLNKIKTHPVTFNKIIMFCSFVRHNEFRVGGVVKKVVFLGAAAAFLLFCYVRIYHVVHASGRSIRDDSTSTFSPLRLKREMMLLKTIMVIFLMFIICYLPLSIFYAVDHERTFPHFVYFFGVMLLWMSSSVNWIIYGFMNRQYQQAYKLILCGTIYHVNGARTSRDNISMSRYSQNELYRMAAGQSGTNGAESGFSSHSIRRSAIKEMVKSSNMNMGNHNCL